MLSAAVAAEDAATAATAREWLLRDMVQGGWGTAWTWDPFGDGSPTPAGTAYAITTAIAIDGLLDSGADTILRAEIGQMLLVWARNAWTDGYYWYSLAAQDAVDTPNVNAMMAGVTLRYLREESGLPEADRELLRDRATRSIDHLGSGHDHHLRWPYSTRAQITNDLSHHAYVLWGAERARDSGAAVGWTRSEALATLEPFDIVYPRDGPQLPEMARREDSPWLVSGAGTALAVSARWGSSIDVDHWAAVACRAVRSQPVVPRFSAHALLGFALAHVSSCEVGR